MYNATAGEAAIKKDTSGAQKLLNNIDDLLSGKKSGTTNKKSSGSLGVLSFDFDSGLDDIWGGGADDIFSSKGSSNDNLSSKEGKELYEAAYKQCAELTADACTSTAAFNLSKSSYSILVTQDCNAYEKKVNAKKTSVQETVRTAEKYLREARLEDYKNHNSADVNDCINKVRTELYKDTACGKNYQKCMDYSGVYINNITGEPIYSPRLFNLTSIIKLDGSLDVLAQNKDFEKFLDSKKMFAETALDTCRDL